MTTYLTGDTHGSFERVVRFARANNLTANDTIIVLGDASINYEGRDTDHDQGIRDMLAPLACTVFCLHGNHDMRPYRLDCYRREIWHGGVTYLSLIHI